MSQATCAQRGEKPKSTVGRGLHARGSRLEPSTELNCSTHSDVELGMAVGAVVADAVAAVGEPLAEPELRACQ